MFDRVGGFAFFEELTRRFYYEGVAGDAVLRPLYPEDAGRFEESRTWLRDFLVQYWGGPSTYAAERGQPQLRMRHAPFAIGPAERDAWLAHMTEAVTAAALSGLDESQMLTYFRAAAEHMVNQRG